VSFTSHATNLVPDDTNASDGGMSQVAVLPPSLRELARESSECPWRQPSTFLRCDRDVR